MTDEQILALYDWMVGDCFRCARTSLDVADIAEIETPAGKQYAVAACRSCILALEDERRRRAERLGAPYRPGCIGRPCT